jgi:hypothetical protein
MVVGDVCETELKQYIKKKLSLNDYQVYFILKMFNSIDSKKDNHSKIPQRFTNELMT